jgi:protocatechuate 3,4-dioxygenase beta subunit
VSLLIRVRDTAGHPMIKAQVEVFNIDEERQAIPAVTDSLGQIVFCSVAPGRYRVSARLKGQGASITNHVVPAAAADTLQLVLRAPMWQEEPGVRMSRPPAVASAQPDPKAPGPVSCNGKE